MEKNDPKVTNITNDPEAKASVYLVDPNPPGREIVPPEDLFTYVNLKAIRRNRSVIETNGNAGNVSLSQSETTEGEINFIATEIPYAPNGKSNGDGGKTYATTSWSDIGGIKNNSNGILEGFGINSIDITYGASLVPQVDMSFTDLRGASLFDVTDSENRQSPYSLFFEMPYPIFKLSVKGYYGKAVTYCLHMINWSSDFDGSTGNFNIKAKFVGFQQAFMADMVLGNIIGVANTDDGAKKLANITITDVDDGTERETPKLDDFINGVAKLPIKVESLKQSSKDFDELKVMNSKLAKLKKIRSFIGSPIPKNPNDKKENSLRAVISANLSKDWFEEGDYVVVRDIVVVKEIKREEFIDYSDKAFELIENYNNFVKKNPGETPKEITENIFTKGENDKVGWLGVKEIYGPPTTNENEENYYFDTLYDDILSNTGSTNEVVVRWATEGFDFGELGNNRSVYIGVGEFTNGRENVFALDFHDMRYNIQSLIDELEGKIDTKQEKALNNLNTELKKNLDPNFNPTIKEVIEIILNNTQAMIESVYSVSESAENSGLKKRYESLLKYDAETDVKEIEDQTGGSLYAWPEVIQRDVEMGRGEKTTKWLGDVIPLEDSETRSLFPEIEFVENVVKGYVESTNTIKKTKKEVNDILKNNKNKGFYPSYPGEIDNRYTDIGINLPNAWQDQYKSISTILYKQIIETCFIFNHNSQFGVIEPSTKGITHEYTTLDAALFSETLKISEYKKQFNSNNFNKKNLLDYGINNKLFTISDGYYVSTTQGVFNEPSTDEESYIVLDNIAKYNNIINNDESISDATSDKYSASIENINNYYKSTEPKKEGIKTFNSNYKLPNHEMSYLVWGEGNKSNIIGDSALDSKYKLNIEKLEDVQGKEYIGVLREDVSLIGSEIYERQTKNNKALMLLNTLPFDNPDIILPLFSDRAKVVSLPKLYLVWMGATLWRTPTENTINEEDTITWDAETKSNGGTYESEENVVQPGIKNFLTTIGSKQREKIYGDNNTIPAKLLGLNKKTKDSLIKYFEQWVTSNFGDFETKVEAYRTGLTDGNPDDAAKNLLIELNKTSNIISVSPKVWSNEYGFAKVEKNNFESYIENFINVVVKECSIATNANQKKPLGEEEKEEQNISNNSDLKNVFYKYFKNINDKWLGGTQNGKIYNVCGPNDDKDLIDYFKFINRAWCDVGDEAVINLNSLQSLSANLEGNIYFLIAKLLRDSNFLLQILPTFINFRKEEDIKSMFKPITELGELNSSPIYVCIQAGGNSKVLEIPKGNYKSDTFVFSNSSDVSELPDEFGSCSKPNDPDGAAYSLVAFRVAFGSENQTLFKNISLNQEEHRETGEYFKALTELIDKRGGTKRTYQGTDLYPIFQTRSYTAKIESLGCLNIQPLMYFQLDNVPFFHGSYLITNVNHSITPNHITTNFSGVRQSNVTTPIITNATTFLNIDLSEELENVIDVDTTPPTREELPFGAKTEDPNVEFDFQNIVVPVVNGLPDRRVIADLGIKKTDKQGGDIDTLFTDPSGNNDGNNTPFAKILKDEFGIITNAQVSMFLANLIVETSGLFYREEIWNNPGLINGVAQNGSKAQLNYDKATHTDEKKNGKYKYEDLGNTEDGDGYKYRGRGYIQITGKGTYTTINGDSSFKNKLDPTGDLVSDPDIITKSLENSLKSACQYWITTTMGESNSPNDPTITINEFAKDGKAATFEIVNERVNSGDIAGAQRKKDSWENILEKLDIKDEENL